MPAHKPTPQQALWEARRIAERHGMYIAVCTPRSKREKGEVYVLYRRARAPEIRDQRIAKRSDVYAMLALARTYEPKEAAQHSSAPVMA